MSTINKTLDITLAGSEPVEDSGLFQETLTAIRSADVAKGKEEQVATEQFDKNNADRAELTARADDLAAITVSTSEAEKGFAKANANLARAETDAYSKTLESTNAAVDKATAHRDQLLDLKQENLDQIEEINLRQDGFKKDDAGNVVPMSTGEKILSFVFNDLAYSPTQRKAMLRDAVVQNDQAILSTQAEIGNTITASSFLKPSWT